jgi:hypothetical protein
LDRSIHGLLIEDVKDLLDGFDDHHHLVHVKHFFNEVAHMLAKDGCENKVCKTWLEVPPRYIVDLLASDSDDV